MAPAGAHRCQLPSRGAFLLADVTGTYGTTHAGRTITSAANVAVVPGTDFAAPDHAPISWSAVHLGGIPIGRRDAHR